MTIEKEKKLLGKKGKRKGDATKNEDGKGGVRKKKREANLVLHLTIAYCTFEEKPFYY